MTSLAYEGFVLQQTFSASECLATYDTLDSFPPAMDNNMLLQIISFDECFLTDL